MGLGRPWLATPGTDCTLESLHIHCHYHDRSCGISHIATLRLFTPASCSSVQVVDQVASFRSFFVGVVVRRAREAVTSYRAQLRESGNSSKIGLVVVKGAEKQFSGVARGEQRRGGSKTLLTTVNRNPQNEGAW